MKSANWQDGYGANPGRLLRALGAALLLGLGLLTRDAGSANMALPLTTYDRDFPAIGYSGKATHNALAELAGRIERGELTLAYVPGRGYLDDLLRALDIDPSSQMLVFSKTSLQAAHIDSDKPRALYFNDSTYVAWVQDTQVLEAVSIDAERGPVYYTIGNVATRAPTLMRETTRCLVCHDSATMRGNGLPQVLVKSAVVEGMPNPPDRTAAVIITHASAIEERWGGWYVTGKLGMQLHLGNLPVVGSQIGIPASIHNHNNLDGLEGYFDTRPYLTDKSDIVPLLVLEHQSYVHNLITRVRYQSSLFEQPARWDQLAAEKQAELQPALDELVTAMTFQNEVHLVAKIRGTAGYESWFESRGPRDAAGRSLRQFDLATRTFRYPLSYLVYSPDFDALPPYARDYVYRQFIQVLEREPGGGLPVICAADRQAALEILAATKPEFARYRAARGG
ncbi:MAG: hypothetical protein QM718_11975 [Steroidobacteraceae bacterium]